jgi:hypothetical protein
MMIVDMSHQMKKTLTLKIHFKCWLLFKQFAFFNTCCILINKFFD